MTTDDTDSEGDCETGGPGHMARTSEFVSSFGNVCSIIRSSPNTKYGGILAVA